MDDETQEDTTHDWQQSDESDTEVSSDPYSDSSYGDGGYGDSGDSEQSGDDGQYAGGDYDAGGDTSYHDTGYDSGIGYYDTSDSGISDPGIGDANMGDYGTDDDGTPCQLIFKDGYPWLEPGSPMAVGTKFTVHCAWTNTGSGSCDKVQYLCTISQVAEPVAKDSASLGGCYSGKTCRHDSVFTGLQRGNYTITVQLSTASMAGQAIATLDLEVR